MSVSGPVMMNSTSRKMEHHHILLCSFVRGFTAVLAVGGLGVESKHGLREVLILFIVISVWGFWSERRSAIDKQERAMNWNKKFDILFTAVRLYFLRKMVESVSCRLQKCAKCWGLCWHVALNGSEWDVKWCKNRSNIALRSWYMANSINKASEED